MINLDDARRLIVEGFVLVCLVAALTLLAVAYPSTSWMHSGATWKTGLWQECTRNSSASQWSCQVIEHPQGWQKFSESMCTISLLTILLCLLVVIFYICMIVCAPNFNKWITEAPILILGIISIALTTAVVILMGVNSNDMTFGYSFNLAVSTIGLGLLAVLFQVWEMCIRTDTLYYVPTTGGGTRRLMALA